MKFSIPLLKDHHHHPSLYISIVRNCIVATPIEDKKKVLSLIDNSEDDIIVVGGWDCTKYNLTKQEINHFKKPVIICNRSFHRYIINDIFRDRLIDFYTYIVSNIENQKWAEKNIFNIMKFLVNIKPFTEKQLKEHFNSMLKNWGIYFAEEMMLPDQLTFERYIKLGLLDNRTEVWVELDKFKSLPESYQEKVKGIKVFLDGAFGSYAAAMKDPYLTGQYGFLNYTSNELMNILEKSNEFNKGISFHNVGDKATEQIIDVIELIDKNNGKRPDFIRLEHNIFIDQKYARKAKDLNIILCMQPNFSFDTIRFRDRVTKRYLDRINPFRMLIDKIGFTSGEDLIFGSDGMPQGINEAIYRALYPPLESQRLTIQEFKKGYCINNKDYGYIDININKNMIKTKTNYKTELLL